MPTVITRTFAWLSNSKLTSHHRLNRMPTQESLQSSDTEPSVSGSPSSGTSQHVSIEVEVPKEKPDVTIWKATELGNRGAVQYYIQNSETDLSTLLDTRDPDTNCTLLHVAISNVSEPNLSPLLQLLLSHGADARAQNMYNVQAIHMVPLNCPEQPIACLDLLLKHKADVHARDGDGWTALHYAARFCQPPEPAMNFLLSQGANINQQDHSHKTPLFLLLANGDHSRTLDWLINTAKAKLTLLGDIVDNNDHQTRPGSLVLQAAKYGRSECLIVLIHSELALGQLCKVITRQELALAHRFVLNSPTMQLLLKELEDILERDPRSLLHTALMKEKHPHKSSTMTVWGLVAHSPLNRAFFENTCRFLRRK